MRIGITYNPSINLFLSGFNQTAIVLARLFVKLNYDVTLVDSKNSDSEWWPEINKLSDVKFTKMFQTKDLDYLIDIDGFVSSDFRKKAAKNTIVFLRTSLQFSEMDNSVYPEKNYIPRSFDNISEIWCWDILNPPETLPSIQTLFKCPIKTVPFIWSSLSIPQTTKNEFTYQPNSDWNIHIAEKNNNASSFIIPIVASRELTLKNIIKAKYFIHNTDKLKDNRFLKENILNNIEIDKISVEFLEKEEIYKWSNQDNSLMLSHLRFVPLRLGLINALWLGIPLIHNSPILKDIHPELANMFYFSNDISNMCDVIKRFCNQPEKYYLAHYEIKKRITELWSIDNNIDKWRNIVNSLTQIEKDIIPIVTEIKSEIKDNNTLIVAFSDMWPGFNYNSNFIIDSLRNELLSLKMNTQIKGIQYNQDIKPNLVIFGPYSNTWKLIPNDIPKVYFSGENWTKPDDKSINLYLTSSRKEDDRHFRVPTWMMFIDWFSDSKDLPENCEDNPIRMPLHFAMNQHPTKFNDRSEFCGFVVSNPVCDFRNYMFFVLNKYKPVNSGGALYNNIGGQLKLKYPGGGCGDISKYHFFSHHKFSISFENSQGNGYITEKVLHAKMAGCIPIYWGDPNLDTDFVDDSILNVSKITNCDQILEIVKDLENNPERCNKIASTPILDESRKQKALKTISTMSQKLLSLCGVTLTSHTLKNIDKIFVVNLDTRKDRWEKLCMDEPFISSISERVPAINGKNIVMTPYIKTLFKNNTFGWKKSVMGCALSHIQIWTKILSLPGKYFLILEDDVRFLPQELSNWNNYAENIPADSELLYIGGVLPPNKIALPAALEPVNEFWSKIKPNNFFTPGKELPIFHFCTYSYIISKSGAHKLLNSLLHSENKMNLPVDHFLGRQSLSLKTFVSNNLITKCFQDDDPQYQTAQFNNSSNAGQFDSDICNSTECFTEEEFSDNSITLYHIGSDFTELYEDKWIKDIFGNYCLKSIMNIENFDKPNCWFFVQRPHLNSWNEFFKYLCLKNIDFKVIHLSDEANIDPIDFYSYSNCKVVIRNYVRPEIKEMKNVLVIPLGYHHKSENNKSFSDRKLVWSFHGNDWFDRAKYLEQLQSFLPHSCHLIQGWNHSTMTNENKYINTLSDSKFCPIMRGNNFETFRLYESLEAGVIPIYIRSEGDTEFWNFVSSKIKLVNLDSINKVTELINILLNNPQAAEKYRLELNQQWYLWKEEIKQKCRQFIE
jgi:GR25 family glycosyltransferase involved in LPS biosynthesis